MAYFAISFLLSLLFTLCVRLLAIRLKVVDVPDGERKKHGRAVPLLGGVAIFLAFWATVGYTAFFHPIFGIERLASKLLAAFVASVIIMIVGVLDDVRPFSAWWRLIFTGVATAMAIWLGITLEKITNPWGGFVELSLVVGNVAVWFWLMGIMYATKIVDGLDGLATGVVAIGAMMIYFLTQTTKFYQPNVGLLALIFAGACLGFLFFNFYPAKIFLGESGGLFCGFILAVLAVISGGKVATALLVVAVPVLDLARVMYCRVRHGKPVFQGDREHLHFQLLDYGLSERQVVIIYYVIAALFGAAALFLQSTQKLAVLLLLLVGMVALGWRLNTKQRVIPTKSGSPGLK